MKRGQQGFGVVETLLVLILLSILGFTGYYVYHTRNNANSSYNNAASTNSNPKSTISSENNGITTEAASNLVSDFYSKYYQLSGGSNVNATPDRDQMKALVQQYGTDNLVNTYNSARAFDPITCSQQVDPMSVITSKASGSKVTVTVRDSLASGAQAFTVDVVNTSGLKINSVNCPQLNQ